MSIISQIEPADELLADADFTDEDVFAAVAVTDPKGTGSTQNLNIKTFDELHAPTLEMLKFHEGSRHIVGFDEGNLNAGFGHTLDHNDKYVLNDSIPVAVQNKWLDSDFNDSTIDARKIFPEFDNFNEDRQAGILDIAFHAGRGTLINDFDGFIAAINQPNPDWARAALELQYIEIDDSTHVNYMKESDYFKKYPLRAGHIIGLINGTMTVQDVLDEYKP